MNTWRLSQSPHRRHRAKQRWDGDILVVSNAAACGFIEPFEDVIAVGGNSRGAGTAIVMNATYPNHAFGEAPEKRMRIKEILCKVP